MAVSTENHNTRQTEVLAQILKMLAEIQFGSIEIIIHDGKVAHIERKEKIRPNVLIP